MERPVLVALRGRITNNGEMVATIIDKGCTRGAIFPTDKDPGKSFKADFERLGFTRAKIER
ncbi:hypothetical protein CWR43_14300 [Rhizobium sullae]|uniref:Uncharacterized protein n=1 Tax=Rhizobium sullae TaxID=50338 RepID=A0A2N0DAT5_RHISU|nr:hypothetical protein CWR43_14300 [Rhizobium sullae]